MNIFPLMNSTSHPDRQTFLSRGDEGKILSLVLPKHVGLDRAQQCETQLLSFEHWTVTTLTTDTLLEEADL